MQKGLCKRTLAHSSPVHSPLSEAEITKKIVSVGLQSHFRTIRHFKAAQCVCFGKYIHPYNSNLENVYAATSSLSRSDKNLVSEVAPIKTVAQTRNQKQVNWYRLTWENSNVKIIAIVT